MKKRKFRVKETATWRDMGEKNYGQIIPADHRGEIGILIGMTDGCPDLEFDDGTWAGYSAQDVTEIRHPYMEIIIGREKKEVIQEAQKWGVPWGKRKDTGGTYFFLIVSPELEEKIREERAEVHYQHFLLDEEKREKKVSLLFLDSTEI